MVKTNKCNSYVINGQKINVNDIIEHYNGNLGMACNEISQKTLVSFETAKYYVELCQKDEPFIKQNSSASFACGILGTIAFVLSALGLGIGIIVIPLVIVSIIVGIIDIVTIDSEIPRKHNGMVIGLILDAFLVFVALFL